MVTVSTATIDTGAHYNLAGSAPDIASVAADGTVKAWKSGKAAITASVVGYPAIAAVCSVTIIADPPVPTITADQTITAGSEAAFDVSVAQAYGLMLVGGDLCGSLYPGLKSPCPRIPYGATPAPLRTAKVSARVK